MDAVLICLHKEAGGRIAVVFDGSEESRFAVQRAFDVARIRHGRVTVIAVAPKPWFTVGMAGIWGQVCPVRLAQELLEYTAQCLDEVMDTIRDDVPCTTILRSGSRARVCRDVLRRFEHDVLVTVPPTTRARIRRARVRQGFAALD